MLLLATTTPFVSVGLGRKEEEEKKTGIGGDDDRVHDQGGAEHF
jgi:hypothetical protein